MSYKILDNISNYFKEEQAVSIFFNIAKNRKSQEHFVGEELTIKNETDPKLNKLWVVSKFKEEKDDILVEIISAIVYDEIPDIVLDQYNEIKKSNNL